MSVSGVFLDAEFKYFSRISLSPTPFAPDYRAGSFCPRTLMCFYRGRREEFKDLFSQEDGVVFSAMFVPLWKFLATNLTQIIDACSLISQMLA